MHPREMTTMSRMYLVYGLVVIGLMATAQYQGWRPTSVTVHPAC